MMAHAALGRQGADQPPQVGTLADRLNHPIEDLGGVPAGLLLQGGHDPDLPQIGVVHAARHAVDALLDGHAELLVGPHPLELRLRGLRGVLHHGGQRAGEAVSRAHGGGHDLQALGELVPEGAALAAQAKSAVRAGAKDDEHGEEHPNQGAHAQRDRQ